MPIIAPLRGWRYHNFPLALVISPPYDVVDERKAQELRSRHPYNIIHLEESREGKGPEAYTAAALLWQRWRQEGVLKPESSPALYFYAQSFHWQEKTYTRRGFFCLLKLEPYGRGILPHEETLARARSDRWELLRACRAHFSPIFGLYLGEEEETEALWREILRLPADLDFSDPEGQGHKLWVVKEKSLIEKAQALLANRVVLLADGHHRFETALRYREFFEEEGAHDWILAYLASARDPGILILPTHRLLRLPLKARLQELLARAEETFFTVRRISALSLLHPLPAETIGLYAGKEEAFLFSLRPGVDPARVLPGEHPPAWKRLTVTVLHRLLLERSWGLSWKEEEMSYTHEAAEALARVDQGEYELAFLLPPPSMEEIAAVATSGAKMPQKSTYFYPKVPAGLVIFSLDNG
ncbi:conserved hypothetical protein [Ammonifex degensii KC4]|uniref:DUF1015 domain-containing protein n=1 Tax=Ammonifex degensii (strain DSM 10501 / KC4) TaxID=429009 RepID=C9R805_AMMDK|nr:DUF1015 domain-containing protein [Ammonifex degensii]ACX52434.1 conserved hypothetical protein [Ammonifex degensii KC4]